jgi:hypothetical protein
MLPPIRANMVVSCVDDFRFKGSVWTSGIWYFSVDRMTIFVIIIQILVHPIIRAFNDFKNFIYVAKFIIRINNPIGNNKFGVIV